MGEDYKKRQQRLKELLQDTEDLKKFAQLYGIQNILDTTSIRLIQVLTALNLQALPSLHGNDAISESGTEWEIKTINLASNKNFGFSVASVGLTEHALARFRKAAWAFGVFAKECILRELYIMRPEQLEIRFSSWEKRLKELGKKELYRPKICYNFVRQTGIKVFGDGYYINPDSITRSLQNNHC